MKIIGKTKDYFDYLVFQYGVDERLVLDRRGIGFFKQDHYNKEIGSYSGMAVHHEHVSKEPRPFSGRYVVDKTIRFSRDWEINKWLVVNGRGYPLVYNETTEKLEIADDSNSFEYDRIYLWKPKTEAGSEQEVFKKLSVFCKRHAFIASCNGDSVWYISGDVPVLSDLKFAKIMSPQEIYLQTVDFISQNFVDKGEEIAVQSDLEKILSHGFDKKTSFRGKR